MAAPVSEGLAEFIAHTYLTRSANGIATTVAMGLAAAIASNPDPVYGDGFRLVQHAVSKYGFKPVVTALSTGELRSVGLG